MFNPRTARQTGPGGRVPSAGVRIRTQRNTGEPVLPSEEPPRWTGQAGTRPILAAGPSAWRNPHARDLKVPLTPAEAGWPPATAATRSPREPGCGHVRGGMLEAQHPTSAGDRGAIR